MSEQSASGKVGVFAVIGRASVGKSTLVNALVGEKVSIVSPVPQTTRNRIRGIWTGDRDQLVLLDTPGLHKASHDLGRTMNKIARGSVQGVDAAVLVLDSSRLPMVEDEGWMQRLAGLDLQIVMVLNKSDLIKDEAAGSRTRQCYENLWRNAAQVRPSDWPQPRWVEVSAKSGVGVDSLRELLLELAPPGEPLFPPDIVTDFPRDFIIADTIREKLFASLRDELPHCIAVSVSAFRDNGQTWDVDADVFVNKESQKRIVIGRGGRMLESARLAAERELAEMYDRPVRLHLWVRVRKNWAGDAAFLRRLGCLE